MLFNSIEFVFFLPTVFVLYWFVFKNNLTKQNFLLLVASYFFYGWWDWRFLSLIFISSFVDFFIAQFIDKELNVKRRKLLLLISISINLSFLGFFKYYNFFVESFVEAFKFFGTEFSPKTLNIVLPVGISFYTFQTLSYTIDVYRKKISADKNPISFFTFVSFFPQLVAGPIERAANLLPQFSMKRKFSYENGVNGMRQILWGLFKKMVIADNCAEYANLIFDNHEAYSGSTLFLGAALFAFQIYGDFSGYSDIAIGTARLFGFNLTKNFAFPYFSRDIAEFWRRWHMSLTTWFRDYVYIPLGGSQKGRYRSVVNVFIIFIISGLWHGDNWTFIFWGFLNALLFIPLLLMNKNRRNTDNIAGGRLFVSIKDAIKIVTTFLVTVFAWIFFRSESITEAFSFFKGMFSWSIISIPQRLPYFTIALLGLFIFIEWIGRNYEYALEKLLTTYPKAYRWSFYLFIAFLISIFSGKQQIFIYFQF